jgi:hypothetical protein
MNRDRMKRRHVRDKAVIDHLADKVFKPGSNPDAGRQRATTDTGLSVEKQVRKTWDPKKGGLPIFHREPRERKFDRPSNRSRAPVGGGGWPGRAVIPRP